jgi:hypothetical protein
MKRSTITRSSFRRSGDEGGIQSGDVILAEQFFARDMNVPTAAHPIVPAAGIAADGTYPDITIGGFAQGVQEGLTFRALVPSVARHGADAGTLLISYVTKPAAAPAGVALNVLWRLQTRRILDFAPLAAWDSLGVTGPQAFSVGSVDFRYRDWLSPLVLGVDINLVAGEYFEAEIYRETPIADEVAGDANLYVVNFTWLAA